MIFDSALGLFSFILLQKRQVFYPDLTWRITLWAKIQNKCYLSIICFKCFKSNTFHTYALYSFSPQYAIGIHIYLHCFSIFFLLCSEDLVRGLNLKVLTSIVMGHPVKSSRVQIVKFW